MRKRKNKKGALQITLQQFTMFVVFFIVIVFVSKLYADNFSRAKSNTINFLDDNFLFNVNEGITENDLLQEPIPEELLTYVTDLSYELFDTPIYTYEDDGVIYLVSPFREGIENPENYEQFNIYFTYTTYTSTPGIIISIYNKNTKQHYIVATPKNNEYVRGKQLCVLPTSEDSYEIPAVVMNHFNFGPDRLSGSQLIERGAQPTITMGFAEEDTDFFDNQLDFNAQYAVSSSTAAVIFKYEETGNNNIKIPVYVYGNTACFLGVGYGNHNQVYYTGNQLTGNGPMSWNLVQRINQEATS